MAENKRSAAMALMIVSAVGFVLLALGTVWHAQHGDLGMAWLMGLIALIPAVLLYELLRRWPRG